MKVKTVTDFRDRDNDLILRKRNEVFEVSNSRGNKLIGLGLVEKVNLKTGKIADD